MSSDDSPRKESDTLYLGEQSVHKRYHVPYPRKEGQEEPLKEEAREWYLKRKASYSAKLKTYNALDWVGLVLPCAVWLRTYKVKDWLVNDIVAGLSVGAMVIPQGMSYAQLAGLPSVYGLYGAFVPCLIYSLFGSSKQLAVGPVAVTSLILGSNLHKVISQDEPQYSGTCKTLETNPSKCKVYNANTPGVFGDYQYDYNHAAVQVAFIAGVMYTCVGLLRLGWLTNFLSHSVISGFMTGASIIIGMSQVKYILGITIPRKDRIQEQLDDIFSNIGDFQWREFVMGMSWIFLLVLFKVLSRRVNRLKFLRALGPLTVTVLGIAIMNIFKLGQKGKIAPIGHIPSGLPGETVSWWFPLLDTGEVFKLAIYVCVIDVMESISIAKALAQRNQYRLNATQELCALGFANLVGSMFNCYTTTGSFSRSAVNNDCGAKTPLASFTTSILLMVVLLVLTPVFTYMPKNVQGAIIIVGISSLFDYTEAIFLWKVNKLDFMVWITAFFVTIFAGVDWGIGVSVGLALLLVLYKVAFPHTAILGHLPDTDVYRNIKQYPEAQTIPGVLVIRIDAPIYFANCHPIRDALQKYEEREVEKAVQRGTPVQYVVIDLSPVTDIDATAVHFLRDVVREHKERGLQLVLANPSRVVVRKLEHASLPELIGEEWIFVRTHDAVQHCRSLMVESNSKIAAPLV